MYARETASWRAQAIGQDVVDLALAVPWLIVAAIATLRGSRRASLALGSGLGFAAYSFVVYAFDVRFNQMFLVYCAILGVSTYGLIALAAHGAARHLRADVLAPAPRRVASVTLIASATLFALMWLGEDVPAIVRGAPPASLMDVGLATNAVHVLDLSLVLPAMLVSGVLLWRQRRMGHALASIAMGFCVLMELNIAGIMIAMQRLGVAATSSMVWVFTGLAAFAAVLLVSLLRAVR